MLHPPLRAISYEALFGLLAVSGMRVGEAVALDCDDIDLAAGVVRIREQVAKLERARLVPLHASTSDALDRYASTRARLCPRPGSTAFFLSGAGTRIDRSDVSKTMRKITIALGLRTEATRPRTHDLRAHDLVSAGLIP
jgi:integrase